MRKGAMSSLAHPLQNRSDAPRHEFFVAEALGARFFARRHAEYGLKDLAAHGFDALFALGNHARPDIHVVAHAAERVAVGRNLDHRNGRKTDGAAAARGERNQVAAARGETGERDRIIAWRVHEYEAG